MVNHILAKVSRNFYKLISDETLFESISFSSEVFVEYNSNHNLDEDCWFKISNFKAKTFCLDILKSDFDSKLYEELSKDQFGNIKFILSIQDENYFFQKVTPSLFIKKKFLCFGEVAQLEESSNILVINNVPDAIYFKTEDVLIFKKLSSISSIFKGIDVLYKEATKAEVVDFLNNDFISLNNFGEEKVSKLNRRRIAMAIDTLKDLDEDKKMAIRSYINKYCSDTLNYNDSEGKFIISSDEQLKSLLYGIDERFYTTEINDEKRLANSVIKLG